MGKQAAERLFEKLDFRGVCIIMSLHDLKSGQLRGSNYACIKFDALTMYLSRTFLSSIT